MKALTTKPVPAGNQLARGSLPAVSLRCKFTAVPSILPVFDDKSISRLPVQ